MTDNKDDSKAEIVIIDDLSQIRDTPQEFENRDLFLDLSEKNKKIHLNSNLDGLSKSATLELNERSARLEAEGKKIIRFGIGQSPFPIPDHFVQALRDNAHQKSYLPVKGIPPLRNAIASFYSQKTGLDIDAKQVIVGPGSKELLFLTQLTFNGDLIVPSPCWVSYIPQAMIIGRRVQILHTDFDSRWRVTPEHLEAICEQDRTSKTRKSRLLVLNYPGNPDGCTYTSEELRQLAEVARKYKILILSDEIYGDLHFEGQHTSIATYYPEGTIISNGLSKWAAAGGWRLGTFIFPKQLSWLRDAMAVVASETYSCVSAPIQYAAITAFTPDARIDAFLYQSRRILKTLGLWCAKTLQAADIHVHRPSGAFYLFLDFSAFADAFQEQGINTGKDLTDRLLQDVGVAILPGADFARPLDEYTARLAYVNFDGGRALELATSEYSDKDLDQEFLEICCSDVLAGIDELLSWLSRF